MFQAVFGARAPALCMVASSCTRRVHIRIEAPPPSPHELTGATSFDVVLWEPLSSDLLTTGAASAVMGAQYTACMAAAGEAGLGPGQGGLYDADSGEGCHHCPVVRSSSSGGGVDGGPATEVLWCGWVFDLRYAPGSCGWVSDVLDRVEACAGGVLWARSADAAAFSRVPPSSATAGAAGRGPARLLMHLDAAAPAPAWYEVVVHPHRAVLSVHALQEAGRRLVRVPVFSSDTRLDYAGLPPVRCRGWRLCGRGGGEGGVGVGCGLLGDLRARCRAPAAPPFPAQRWLGLSQAWAPGHGQVVVACACPGAVVTSECGRGGVGVCAAAATAGPCAAADGQARPSAAALQPPLPLGRVPVSSPGPGVPGGHPHAVGPGLPCRPPGRRRCGRCALPGVPRLLGGDRRSSNAT